MDRNTVIGVVLIFLILITWQWFMAPSKEQIATQKQQQDSLARAAFIQDSLATLTPIPKQDTSLSQKQDSIVSAEMAGRFGTFAPSATGTEATHVLENEYMKVTFSSKGAGIREVLLKKYFKMVEDSTKKDVKVPLYLMSEKNDKMTFLLPFSRGGSQKIKTSDLYFEALPEGNTLTFRAPAGQGKYFEQVYRLAPDNYELEFSAKAVGLESDIDAKSVQFDWTNYLEKIEKNHNYERTYSTIFYKTTDESPDYLSWTKNDELALPKSTKWVSHSHQFFNSTFFADQSFEGVNLKVEVLDPELPDLKIASSTFNTPLDKVEGFSGKWYVGPNEFKRMKDIGYEFEDVIPFGWSIFGTINRWVIRPMFNFLTAFIPSAGIVILLLTLLVKALLFPLSYKMIYSQSRMTVLKPEIAKLKDKFKDDTQQQQMETMKLYREYGVNPLGGCLPVLLQMPIWFALYRFFPASIEFRQESFLWANDLSSYDVFAHLPFNIPFYGEHVSMFTLIWVVSTIAYTWYNAQFVDYSANPMMKYMQYIMPVMFIFFFNSFASGLTAYLVFSNLLNIGQTFFTKAYLIDENKILHEMEENRKKPKKKTGLSARLEQAMQQQQEIAKQRQQEPKGRK